MSKEMPPAAGSGLRAGADGHAEMRSRTLPLSPSPPPPPEPLDECDSSRDGTGASRRGCTVEVRAATPGLTSRASELNERTPLLVALPLPLQRTRCSRYWRSWPRKLSRFGSDCCGSSSGTGPSSWTEEREREGRIWRQVDMCQDASVGLRAALRGRR